MYPHRDERLGSGLGPGIESRRGEHLDVDTLGELGVVEPDRSGDVEAGQFLDSQVGNEAGQMGISDVNGDAGQASAPNGRRSGTQLSGLAHLDRDIG